MTDPVAVDARGNQLLSFRPGPESDLDELDGAVPLPLALVVARHAGAILLVRNRWRGEWELPGGMLDPGETPRQAAVREFVEETGHRAPEVRYCGLATFRLEPDSRREHGAVYFADVPARGSFVPNDEVTATTWWCGEELDRLSTIDAALARMAADLTPGHG